MATSLDELHAKAKVGDGRAQYELGARLLVGREAPASPAEALRFLSEAAAQDDADAIQLQAVLAALGAGRQQNWDDALALVWRAAELGDARARGQREVISGAYPDLTAWLTTPAPTPRFEAPRVFTISGFVPQPVCAWLIEQARPRLQEVRVNKPSEGATRLDYRSNSGAGFSIVDTDVVFQLVHARVAAAMGLPARQQEPTNVLHYEPGQEYKPHFDFLDPRVPRFQQQLSVIGQRIATFLIYLNDDYEGGETAFPRLDWSFKGNAGDALAFWNVSADGRPDPKTLHAGTAPLAGTKWLFSKWVRDRPLPLI